MKYGYECQECSDGTVKDVTKKNYETAVSGQKFIVPAARIGVCDTCSAVNYHGDELRKWRKIFESRRNK